MGVRELGSDVDLTQEPLGPHDRRELGFQDLQGDLPIVLQIVGEINRSHSALTESGLDVLGYRLARGQAVHIWPG